VVSEEPALALFPLFMWISLALFCTPPEYTYRWRGRSRQAIGLQQAVLGGLHAAAHVLLILCLIWLFAQLNFLWLQAALKPVKNAFLELDSWLVAVNRMLLSGLQAVSEMFPQWARTVISWLVEIFGFLFGWIGALIVTVFAWFGSVLAWLLNYNPSPHSWWQRLLYATEMVVLGGFAAGTLFGLYLIVTNRLFSFHENHAFSSLRIPDYKNFLRLRLTRDGLTVYPIGVRKVPRRWRKSNEQDGPRFEPLDRPILPHLIEEPIKISDESLMREEPEIGVGLSFKETMSGWFSTVTNDPVKIANLDKSQLSKMKLEMTVLIDNFDRFLCDDDHSAVVRGKIILPKLFPHPLYSQTGIVKLFAPYQKTQQKSFVYELTFKDGMQKYYLVGEKVVEDDPGFDIWEDTTTLHVKLYEGTDAKGKLVGAAILKITLRRFFKELLRLFRFKLPFDFRPFNVASFRDRFQAIAIYVAFFAAELWDIYVRRRKAYFVKFMVFSWVSLGAFYLVHGWSIEAASRMTFMEKIAKVSFSDWSPWYWPSALHAILRSYREVYLAEAGILIFPLALTLTLMLCKRDDGTHRWFGVGNFQFCRGWFMRLRGVIHALLQLFLNLILVWVLVKINHSWLQMPLDGFSQRLLFLVEIMLIGGTVGGLVYSVFRDVKLVRPYAG
jgi:hypothetical protein